MNWGATGWLVIAAIVVVATAGLHPSARMAQGFLLRHVPAEELTQDDADSAVVPPPSLLEDPPLSPAGDGVGPPTAQR